MIRWLPPPLKKTVAWTTLILLMLGTAFLIFQITAEPYPHPFFSLGSHSSPDNGLSWLNEPWFGDFDAMAKRNVIRALVPYSKTYYFIDGIDQRGFAYEMLKAFESFINTELNRDVLQVRVVIIPTKRDRLIPDLRAGLGDIAAGNLTITPERAKLVDFCNPGLTNVSEILVLDPEIPIVTRLEDLCGKSIFVRRSSSYYESLLALNRNFKVRGFPPVRIETIDELLEDEDILEMMNAGIIPRTVIDSHKADCWEAIFPDLIFCRHIRLRENAQIAWAIRKKSPKLKKRINAFSKNHQKGSLMWNLLFNRYLGPCSWVSNPMEKDAFERFESSVSLFRKYSKKYRLDWVMVAALAYQESRINQNRESPSGAVGVMQILPSTAADPNVNIPDIDTLEGNIHAGVKYLAFLRDRYFGAEPMDDLNKLLFTLASYNAGPAKIAQFRREAEAMGLNPNLWFDHVEIVAAREIGRETVHYVGNIYKYYIAYRMVVEAGEEKERIKQQYTKG